MDESTINSLMAKVKKRISVARMDLMMEHPFYAMLLVHMKFSVDINCSTAYTDGERIAFSPAFVEELNDSELKFILMHEVLHVALGHTERHAAYMDAELANIAADIVVNSNILQSCNMDLNAISVKGEPSMHCAPDGKEGYEYTFEEVYAMLDKDGGRSKGKKNGKDEKSKETDTGKGEDQGKDKDQGKDQGEGRGKQKKKCKDKGTGDDGWDDHTHWECNAPGKGEGTDISEDDYQKNMRGVWEKRMKEAIDVSTQLEEILHGNKNCGTVPLAAQRKINELINPQTDWRTILVDFIQEEVNDYSFNPPDRRMQDSPFFLPDFNEKDDRVENILFMIDTSGSMSDKMITQAFSEIYGAIMQFNGKLKGWLGFFDAAVVKPQPFCDEDEFKCIKAAGGGGTSFQCIFDYVRDSDLFDDPPASIIILTDGYAPFPQEKEAMDIPVLWLINNEEVTPEWGRIARIKVD